MFTFSFIGFIALIVIVLLVGAFIGILFYRNNEKKMDARFDKVDELYAEKLEEHVEKIKDAVKGKK